MQPDELMYDFTDFLERHGVPYRVVGSLASMVYGEPRLAMDVSVVADLLLANVFALCEKFSPPEFYVSERAVRKAIEKRHQFNVIHLASGLKLDVILPRDTVYSRLEMTRGRQLKLSGEFLVWFCSAEDVILNKLRYYREGGSEKHLRDIAGILKIQGARLDTEYLQKWSCELGVHGEWELVQRSFISGR